MKHASWLISLAATLMIASVSHGTRFKWYDPYLLDVHTQTTADWPRFMAYKGRNIELASHSGFFYFAHWLVAGAMSLGEFVGISSDRSVFFDGLCEHNYSHSSGEFVVDPSRIRETVLSDLTREYWFSATHKDQIKLHSVVYANLQTDPFALAFAQAKASKANGLIVFTGRFDNYFGHQIEAASFLSDNEFTTLEPVRGKVPHLNDFPQELRQLIQERADFPFRSKSGNAVAYFTNFKKRLIVFRIGSAHDKRRAFEFMPYSSKNYYIPIAPPPPPLPPFTRTLPNGDEVISYDYRDIPIDLCSKPWVLSLAQASSMSLDQPIWYSPKTKSLSVGAFGYFANSGRFLLDPSRLSVTTKWAGNKRTFTFSFHVNENESFLVYEVSSSVQNYEHLLAQTKESGSLIDVDTSRDEITAFALPPPLLRPAAPGQKIAFSKYKVVYPHYSRFGKTSQTRVAFPLKETRYRHEPSKLSFSEMQKDRIRELEALQGKNDVIACISCTPEAVSGAPFFLVGSKSFLRREAPSIPARAGGPAPSAPPPPSDADDLATKVAM